MTRRGHPASPWVFSPQRRAGPAVVVVLGTALALVSVRAPAEAQTAAPSVSGVAALDGTYLTIGPVVAGLHSHAGWDGGFGGELGLVRVREACAVAGAGVLVGGVRRVVGHGGRVWLELLAATRRLGDLPVGVTLGLAADVDEVVPPRLGWQAAVFAHAGVTPYVRVGAKWADRWHVEAGLKISLPALSW
jgi:hypothetical protein